MATLWQRLGAFSVEVAAISPEQIKKFAEVGGHTIIPVVFGEDYMEEPNQKHLPRLKELCAPYKIKVGGWFNCWVEDEKELADRITALTKKFQLSPVVLDLEYGYKDQYAHKMPRLLKELRTRMPVRAMAVTSYGYLDRGMIWNGRTLDPPQSFYALGVRYIPQWYYRYDGRYWPSWCMKDLKFNGPWDGNILDNEAPNRLGVPLSYVHGLLMATGVEDHSLKEGIADLYLAQHYGFTKGFFVYTLERMPEEDFKHLAAVRGIFYL